MIKVYFDGACAPTNPRGTCAYGVEIIQFKNKEVVKVVSFGKVYRPKDTSIITTNNLAEYAGLMAALIYLIKNDLTKKQIEVYGDSMLVIKQMSGEWAIDADKPYGYLASKMHIYTQHFTNLTYTHIPRDKNHRADALASIALIEIGIYNCSSRTRSAINKS